MARPRRYETSLLKRIRLAVTRFESLGNAFVKGRPESIQAELDRIRGLRKVIRENLPAAERLFQNRETWRRIREIEQRESQSRGLFKSIFQGALSPNARAEIESLKAKLPQGEMRLAFYEEVSGDTLRNYDKSLAAYEYLLEKSLPSAEERERARAEAAKKRTAEKELARFRQIEKEARIVAMAAAHAGKTRQLAQTIRRNIEHQRALVSTCPYCGSDLGEYPEADHIYPVARGGLSTKENMVFVCALCNGKKRDKTLREFIRAMNFDHSAVEERLELLKKRF